MCMPSGQGRQLRPFQGTRFRSNLMGDFWCAMTGLKCPDQGITKLKLVQTLCENYENRRTVPAWLTVEDFPLTGNADSRPAWSRLMYVNVFRLRVTYSFKAHPLLAICVLLHPMQLTQP